MTGCSELTSDIDKSTSPRHSVRHLDHSRYKVYFLNRGKKYIFLSYSIKVYFHADKYNYCINGINVVDLVCVDDTGSIRIQLGFN